jgi:hypothetical protein
MYLDRETYILLFYIFLFTFALWAYISVYLSAIKMKEQEKHDS